MQFRLAGDATGTFWENRTLDGQLHNPAAGEWLNFGGDKCWPAPQSAWNHQQGHAWPPPYAFDASPVQAIADSSALVLKSPVDPAWGIQVVRHIELEPGQPLMRIETEYRKLHGSPVKVGIWTITQMQEPERVFMLLDSRSKFGDGYVRLLDAEPAELRIHDLGTGGRLLSLARHRRENTKIGADGASMAWIGSTCAVRIDHEPGPGPFPDGGCSIEVYTNADPLPYVELETLGPVASLSAGDRIRHTATYTVSPRSSHDTETEAQRVLCRLPARNL